MNTVNFDEATQSELLAYASDVLGLKPHPNAGIVRLREMIRAAGHTGQTLLIPDPAEPVAPAAPAKQSTAERDASYVILMIAESEAKGAENPVPVNVNGRNVLIPRGKWCQVRWPFYHALQNTIETRWYENPDTRERYSRDVPKYPMQLWSDPTRPPPEMLPATTLAKAKAA